MSPTLNPTIEWFQSLSFDRWVDARMISPIRLVLAAAALLIIYIDPLQPDRLVALTYSLLVAYTAYSALIVAVAFFAPRRLPIPVLHWLDMLWYVALISTSSGTSSIFFLFFFFPILVASFRWGFASGLGTTVTSAALFVAVGYLTGPAEPNFELNRFLLRAITLLVLGYMIAHWGESEIESKRRLNLLKDVTSLSNPRFGVERTIRTGLERLREFYNADAALLAIKQNAEQGCEITRVTRSGSSPPSEHLSDDFAELLLSPGPETVVIRAKVGASALLCDLGTNQAWNERLPVIDSIANWFSAKSFTSVPVKYTADFSGRLYLVGARRRMTATHIEFLLQLIQHVTPILDHIRLVDRMASDAAEQERKKLARDIHDSVIQPYVGLQFGLAAVRRKLENENPAALKDVDELCRVANSEVRSLRHFLDDLHTEEARYGALFPAVRRFAAKYSAATQIAVNVTGEDHLKVNDRLAAQIFQMITEALSNVRRHTLAHKAEIQIGINQENIVVNVINDTANGIASVSFRPRSVTERALALGGTVDVYSDQHNRTVVGIRIPL